ncbi:MAG: hypothetical protein WCL06_10675 [Bacteroidota bacterium]
MFRYLFNPGALLSEKPKAGPLIVGFVLSSVAFALFYLQTSLDKNAPFVLSLLKGLMFGTAGVALAAVLIWLVVMLFGSKTGLIPVMSAIALSYTTTLIFTLVGLTLHFALGWNTALSCGITGVLAAFAPMSGVIARLCHGKKTLNIMIVTFTGVYVLLCWGLLNNLI